MNIIHPKLQIRNQLTDRK